MLKFMFFQTIVNSFEKLSIGISEVYVFEVLLCHQIAFHILGTNIMKILVHPLQGWDEIEVNKITFVVK